MAYDWMDIFINGRHPPLTNQPALGSGAPPPAPASAPRKPAPRPLEQLKLGQDPAFKAAYEKARANAEPKLLASILSKIIYANNPGEAPVIQSKGHLIRLRDLGLQGEPGREALGIFPGDLTTEEMEYLMKRYYQAHPELQPK